MRSRLGIFSSFNKSSDLLLDLYPDAAVAYSTRLLKSDYSGYALRVRRSSDNVEQNIGFINGVLDTDSIISFIGANTGFVNLWYDQSGNGLDAFSLSTTVDPYIILTGTLQVIGGKPCVFFFDDSGSALDHLNIPLYHTSSQEYVANFFAGGIQANGFFPYFIGTSNGDRGFELGLDNNLRTIRPITVRTGGASQYFGSAISTGQIYILGMTANRSTLAAYINGSLNVSGADRNENFSMPSFYRLGNQSTGSTQGQMAICEFVAYSRDISSDIVGIQSEMNSFYEAY